MFFGHPNPLCAKLLPFDYSNERMTSHAFSEILSRPNTCVHLQVTCTNMSVQSYMTETRIKTAIITQLGAFLLLMKIMRNISWSSKSQSIDLCLIPVCELVDLFTHSE